jgi:alanine dehydrogenase
MIIGIPREIMDNEFRVGMIPPGVRAMVEAGHEVVVESSAGRGSGIADVEYAEAGARIAADAREVFRQAEMIIKVKEPLVPELEHFQPEQILYTFLHLAPKPELTDFLCSMKIAAIGYETVRHGDGSLPLLAPMSQVAGRMAAQAGAHYLEKPAGGAGVLLGGVPGVSPGKVTVIGPGTVGRNAMRVALAMGADLTVLGINMQRLEQLDEVYAGKVRTLASNAYNIEKTVMDSDLVIGAVLIPGSSAPRLVTREMVAAMRPGSVIVDVAIDQGGCVETARKTTHSDPVYTEEGVVHYCVANMPGAVPRTSTYALANVTLPYALEIAAKGVRRAVQENQPLREGLNVYGGRIVNRGVAVSQGKEWRELF